MTTKDVPIADLNPAAYNPRKMPPAELAKLTNAVKEFGIVQPIVINIDNTVIGGHQRILAAQELGLDTVPCLTVSLPKDKEKALNLALNRIGGDWDIGALGRLLGELDDSGLVPLTGFDDGELEKYVDREAQQSMQRQIENETEYKQAEDLAAKIIKSITSHVQEIAKRDPTELNRAVMVIVEKGNGNSVIFLADPNTRDVVAELKRYAESGAESPLEMLTEAIWK